MVFPCHPVKKKVNGSVGVHKFTTSAGPEIPPAGLEEFFTEYDTVLSQPLSPIAVISKSKVPNSVYV